MKTNQKKLSVREKSANFSSLNMFNRINALRLLSALLVTAILLSMLGGDRRVSAASAITGKIFRDYNANGIQDAGGAGLPNENQGVSGVTVVSYDSSGAVTATAITAADGSYILSNVTGLQRVEFINLPSWLQEGAAASTGGGSVQFVSAGASNVNYAVAAPQDYSSDRNPSLALTSFVAGDWKDGSSVTFNTINRFPYSSSGSTVKPAFIGRKNQTGSVWGAAYQKTSDRLFTSAFVRRHSSLYENPVGVTHPGQIFLTSNARTVSAASATTVPFFDVATIPGVNPGTVLSNALRGISGANADVTSDPTTFGLVGKTALGGLEISPDDRSLWTISLNDKKLIRITLPASGAAPLPSDATVYQIPEPTANPCTAGQYRPFALAFHQGKLYVGGVCDESGAAGSPAQLKAVVMSADPGNVFAGFTEEYVLPLNYDKGLASDEFSNTATFTPVCGQLRNNWHSWTDDYSKATAEQKNIGNCLGNYAEPMLTDLQFDDDGSMVLAFADRYAYQVTSFSNSPTYNPATPRFDDLEFDFMSGDLVRACRAAGSFITEGAPGCQRAHVKLNSEFNLAEDATHYSYFSDTNNQGVNGGEWYWGDVTRGSGAGNVPTHMETASGGTTLLAGSGQVLSTSMSPVRLNTAGVKWFNTATGKDDVNYEIFTPNQVLAQAKSGALGDLELLTPAAPVELGNRVWNDSNRNGVQDPNERALSGVSVELVINGSVVATALTDSLGNYYFSNNPNAASTSSAVNNISQLQPGAAFTVRIPLNQTALAANSMVVTQANAGGGAVINSPADGRDSDGDNAGSTAALGNTGYTSVSDIAGAVYDGSGNLVTTSPGANSHNYDFGFYMAMPTAANVSVSGKLVDERNRGLTGAVVELTFSNGSKRSVRTNAFGGFMFTEVPASTIAVLNATAKGYRFNPTALQIVQNVSDLIIVGSRGNTLPADSVRPSENSKSE